MINHVIKSLGASVEFFKYVFGFPFIRWSVLAIVVTIYSLTKPRLKDIIGAFWGFRNELAAKDDEKTALEDSKNAEITRIRDDFTQQLATKNTEIAQLRDEIQQLQTREVVETAQIKPAMLNLYNRAFMHAGVSEGVARNNFNAYLNGFGLDVDFPNGEMNLSIRPAV